MLLVRCAGNIFICQFICTFYWLENKYLEKYKVKLDEDTVCWLYVQFSSLPPLFPGFYILSLCLRFAKYRLVARKATYWYFVETLQFYYKCFKGLMKPFKVFALSSSKLFNSSPMKNRSFEHFNRKYYRKKNLCQNNNNSLQIYLDEIHIALACKYREYFLLNALLILTLLWKTLLRLKKMYSST